MRKLALIIERLTIARIVLVWIATVSGFGILYFILSTTVINTQPLSNAFGFGNSMYFSFITAMTLGYGDMAPMGFGKALVVIEAMLSMAMFGLFIAKIVAVKQDELKQEITELTLEEATNNAISELYLFRSEATSLKETLNKKTSAKALESCMSNLRHALGHLHASNLTQQESREKALMRIELTSNSINFSFSKLIELLEAFKQHKIEWQKESTTSAIAEAQKSLKELYAQYNSIKSDDDLSKKAEEKLEDLNKALTTLHKINS